MKAFNPNAAFSRAPRPVEGLAEAAPARNRVRFLAISLFAVLLLLAGRAVQLAFSGDPLAEPRRGVAAAIAIPRADLVDRNGVLMATTVRAFALTAEPHRIGDASAVADTLRGVFADLDRPTLIRRLTDRSRQLVYLRRSLTPEERARVQTLELSGIGFEREDRRVYPQGALAAHALGFTDVDLNPLSGVERGLDETIREAGEAGRQVRLSLDVRMQYALETELASAARAANATGAAAILLDGRSGEVYALASWPTYDANAAGQASDNARRDRVAGDLHELGSTIKPFTVAMALEAEVTNGGELFDLSQPFDIDGHVIEDHEPITGLASLRDILAHSSNVGAARLALRLGGARQRAYLEGLGLTTASTLELGRNQAPLAPRVRGRRDVAGLGFGYGLATTQGRWSSPVTARSACRAPF
jgi:cell division protein FtsI (penicillin-binding protein 3)